MAESMTRKERIARASYMPDIMTAKPRPGHFLKYYVDPTKMPKAPKNNAADDQFTRDMAMAMSMNMPVPPSMIPEAPAHNARSLRNERQTNFLGPQPRRGAP